MIGVGEIITLAEKTNDYINKIEKNEEIQKQLTSKIYIIKTILSCINIKEDENSEIVMNIKYVLKEANNYIEKRKNDSKYKKITSANSFDKILNNILLSLDNRINELNLFMICKTRESVNKYATILKNDINIHEKNIIDKIDKINYDIKNVLNEIIDENKKVNDEMYSAKTVGIFSVGGKSTVGKINIKNKLGEDEITMFKDIYNKIEENNIENTNLNTYGAYAFGGKSKIDEINF